MKNYAMFLFFLWIMSTVMSIVIALVTWPAHLYSGSDESRRCECIVDYNNRIGFIKLLNDTCPAIYPYASCFQYLDSVPLRCVNTSEWLTIWRLMLNGQGLLNIIIAIVVWRSPYLPNLLSLGCCVSAVLSTYVTEKWLAMLGELMTFAGTYTMLGYGIFSKLKFS